MTLDWEWVYESKAEGIATVAILQVEFLVMCYVFGYGAYHILYKSSLPTNTPSRKSKQMSIYTKYSFAATIVLDLCLMFVEWLEYGIGPVAPFRTPCFPRQWNGLFLGGARVATYTFFLVRLYETFAGSVLEIPKKWIFLMVGLFTTTCMGTAFLTIFWYGMVMHCDSDKLYLTLLASISQDLVWSFFFTGLFVYKLKQVGNQATKGSSKADIASNKRAAKLMYLIMKLTILTIVSIMTTWVVVLTMGALGTFGVPLLMVDTVMNAVCVLLTFASQDPSYRIMCFPCRKCCEECRWCTQDYKHIESLLTRMHTSDWRRQTTRHTSSNVDHTVTGSEHTHEPKSVDTHEPKSSVVLTVSEPTSPSPEHDLGTGADADAGTGVSPGSTEMQQVVSNSEIRQEQQPDE